MLFCGIQLKTLTLEGRFLGTCSEIEVIKEGDRLRFILQDFTCCRRGFAFARSSQIPVYISGQTPDTSLLKHNKAKSSTLFQS